MADAALTAPMFGSFFDPITRFMTLPPHLQDWVNEAAVSKNMLPATKDNLAQVRAIAGILPIRIRWYKLDRFGKYFIKTKRGDADHFRITCRLGETK